MINRRALEELRSSLRGKTILLKDLLDINVFVHKSGFKKAGIDLRSIKVKYDEQMYSPGKIMTDWELTESNVYVLTSFFLVIGKRFYNLKDEEMYVMLAHELSHILQGVKGKVDYEALMYMRGRPGMLHADIKYEQEAFFWEALQAAKFQWTDEQYKDFMDVIYGHMPAFVLTEKERRKWAYDTVKRRPCDVRVSRYRRKK